MIAIFAERVPQKASPLSFVPVFPLDGAYAQVADDDTAFGGRRSARFAVFHHNANIKPALAHA